MNTANTTICISRFFKLNIDNHKKRVQMLSVSVLNTPMTWDFPKLKYECEISLQRDVFGNK